MTHRKSHLSPQVVVQPDGSKRTIWVVAKPPSFFQKGLNYAQAIASHAIAGFPMSSEEVHAERLTICESCDRRKPDSWECLECGCPMDTKAAWAEQECPLKKWLKTAGVSSASQPGCGSCG